jgi:hypothetical protein
MLGTPKALNTQLNNALSPKEGRFIANSCLLYSFSLCFTKSKSKGKQRKIIKIRKDNDSDKLDNENFKDNTMDNQQETKDYV